DFTYDQVVHAGYAILDAERGKFLLQAGVRVERATTHFHLKTTGASFDNPYHSLFPSGLIAYNIDDTHQVKLSYSTRIRRPDDTIARSGGRLSGFAGASAFQQVSNASNLGPGLSARTFGWTARINATFRATNTFDLQTLVSYQAPMTVEQGRNASRTRFTLAARKKLMEDRLSVTLRAIDPVNT